MFRTVTFPILMSLPVLCAAIAPTAARAQQSPNPQPVEAPAQVTTVAEGLDYPWGLSFLPDGRMLVTERPGRLRLVTQAGQVSPPLKGVPQVFAEGQGGLLDVTLDPNFASNRLRKV